MKGVHSLVNFLMSFNFHCTERGRNLIFGSPWDSILFMQELGHAKMQCGSSDELDVCSQDQDQVPSR